MSTQEYQVAGFKGRYVPATNTPRSTPLLFIHGAFANHAGFDRMADAFATNGYNSYAFSRRGRLGQPPEHARGLHFNDYLADTVAVIKSITPTPILVGHSLGGLVAMKAAEQIADIPAMVLINTAPPAILTAQVLALVYFFPLMPKIVMGKPFMPSAAAIKTLALQKLDKNEQDKVIGHLVPESGSVYRELMLGQIRLGAHRKNTPALVVGSDNDRIISRRLNRITVRKTGADFLEYKNHGHWLIGEEGMETLVGDISAWLAKADIKNMHTPKPEENQGPRSLPRANDQTMILPAHF